MKYYFENTDSEICYSRDYFFDLMKEREITEIEVYPAKIMISSGFYYCKILETMSESSEGECGKLCEYYKPRNGKNGRCKYHANTYELADKKITLKIK